MPLYLEPDKSEKLAAIEHLVYEYGNLMAAAFYSMNGPAPVRTNADDAFLLGYRKLGDFLLNDPPRKKDDILASDYLPYGTTRTWKLDTWTKEWRGRMNKQLTHIAYERVRKPKEWNHLQWVPLLEKEFRAAWALFWSTVLDPDFTSEYENQLAACRKKTSFEKLVL